MSGAEARPGSAALLGRAARSARSGRYDEACLVLDGLGGGASEDPEVLDLLARIHAQRGELADADACWARVPATAPGAAAAGEGRRRIAALHAGGYRRPGGRRLAVAVLVLAAAGAAVAGVLLPGTSPKEQAEPALGRQLAAVRDQQRDLAHRLADIDGELSDASGGPRRSAPDPATALSAPGTVVSRSGGALLITFDDGIFDQGASLSPTGERALEDLAKRLKGAAGAGPVVVTGHTDDRVLPPSSPYTDRVNLGFARAQVAAERLSSGSGIPMELIGIRSTGTAQPPFPDDSAADRRRNNTVTVLVAPL